MIRVNGFVLLGVGICVGFDCVSNQASAEESGIAKMAEIVVTASRRDIVLRDTPDSVRVINRDEIEQMNPTSMGEIMEYASGVAVETGTGSGLPDRSVISINGLPPSYTLVLLDGTKLLSEHIHTGQNINMIPPSAVERIEIMRGAASAQYGTDAIGGIVNVITRKYDGVPEIGMTTSVGSDETYEVGVHVLTPAGPHAGIASFLNWEQSDGIDIKAPSHRVGNMGYKRFNWYNRVEGVVGDDTRLYGWINWVENEMDWRGETTDSRLVSPVGGVVHALTPALDLTAEFAYSDWEADLSEERNRYWEPEAYMTWAANDNHILLFGGEYREQSFRRTALEETDQRGYGVYAQDDWQVANSIALMTALRYDEVEDQGNAISPKVSLLLSPAEPLRIRASVGRGYHAPSVQELYEEGYGHGGTAYRFGNPDLDPETSTTYTLGLETLPNDDLKFVVYCFYTDMDDMIVPVYEGAWDEDPTLDVWRRQNIKNATVYGAEANVMLALTDRLQIECGYTYTDNEDKDTGHQLPYSPGSSVDGKLIYRQPLPRQMSLLCFVGARAVLGREAWNWKPAAVDTTRAEGLTTKLDDYTKLDIGATLVLNENWQIFTKAQNLLREDIENLDDAYTVVDGNVLFQVGARYRFAPGS
jgi:outer membrane receptor for ferrienterochelin and colicins